MANSIERTGKIFMGTGIKEPLDESLLLENASRKRKEEKERKEASELLIKAEQEKQKEIEERIETLEMVSIGPKVIILPYPVNPYRKRISEGGILIPGRVSFQNPDSGEIETAKDGIMCAKVIEVGPDVKWLKAGDDIYFDSRTAIPLPFYDFGYKVIAELNALTVLNQGLKARYNME